MGIAAQSVASLIRIGSLKSSERLLSCWAMRQACGVQTAQTAECTDRLGGKALVFNIPPGIVRVCTVSLKFALLL